MKRWKRILLSIMVLIAGIIVLVGLALDEGTAKSILLGLGFGSYNGVIITIINHFETKEK